MGYKQFSYLNTLAALSSSAAAPEKDNGRVREIELLTATFFPHSHFASVMLDSFQQEISDLGYTMSIHRIREEHLKNLSLPATFHRERAAAILCVEVFDRPYADMICALGLPVLFVDGPAICCEPALSADLLLMDNSTEIGGFIWEMLRRGKKEIGFVGNWNHCQSFFERYATFRGAMLFSGVPVNEAFCVKSNNREEIQKSIQSMDRMPDIFLCANDFLAMDVLDILREMGKSVPEAVLLCDSPESRRTTPPLTTIHIHTQIMAFSAVHLLMSRIKEPGLDFRIMHTQTDLIYRESTEGKREEKPK